MQVMETLKTNGHEIVKVGMKVMWRGSWGYDQPAETTIEYIELCDCEGCKYGESVDAVPAEDLHRCCVDLTNGHWAYGYQITEILG